MNKNVLIISILLSSFVLLFSSCEDDDDPYQIDEEWKAYNEKVVRDVATSGEYKPLESFSRNGTLYWKYTDVITNTIGLATPKITQEGTPHVTDSVVVRYIGWYLNYDGNKVEFDSTEGNNNAQSGRGFRLSTLAQGGVMGWVDILQYMTVGEEREVCIPQQLGYGTSATSAIPAYTTLFFDIKLLKIVARNEGEFD
ncbi:FKBP-type peptidyl-prolyl cis-trans isomerase [Dysgonomonas sp. 511]|uniref:FKBP-type peptidyl-prolyl cis-trans isomerase n=1 Tax=Dysgonomonas sp. 511 TaxID=2302930 RepID=UPI0013D072F9|nr:FKBP-type peptidyl-prolyl cis-trans isomerase [Dysgonomonas sp. 511]NDV78687.1 hypothetical protein [Dysgonomonas sp. 511]